MTTAEIVRRVYRESQPPLQRSFDLIAERPDEWVTTEEVLEATGLTPSRRPSGSLKRVIGLEGPPFGTSGETVSASVDPA